MKSIVKGILAGLILVAPGLLLADEGDGGTTNESFFQKWKSHHQISSQKPAAANCASRLIGMSVINQNNDRLGTVRDIILDTTSQRVAYAWVEKASETDSSGKYLSVPVYLLGSSPDQKKLMLNIDKSRFESAQGFARDKMPGMDLSQSQLDFWHSIEEPSGAQLPEKKKSSY